MQDPSDQSKLYVKIAVICVDMAQVISYGEPSLVQQEFAHALKMTSEDRNRRMKWGHNVPRWWISDFNMTHRDDTKKNDSINARTEQPTRTSGDELVKSAKVQLFRQRLLNLQSSWPESQRLQSTSLKPRRLSPETSEKYRLKRNARRRMVEEQTSRLNRDIRRLQAAFAILIILIGLYLSGLLGLLVGTGIGLLIISLRLKL